jgi:hypothetical protein
MLDYFSTARDLMSTFDMSLICNGIGVLGFMLYMTSYTLVTFQRIDSRGLLYFWLNTAAATFVLISLTQNFNLASALIQIVWIGLGIIAIVTRLSRPTAAA